MERLQRTLCALLALTLVGQSLGAAAYAQPGNGRLAYTDVENGAPWALQYVAKLAQQGIFTGYEDGSFRPNTTITRVEALVAAVRLMGLKEEAESEKRKTARLQAKDADLIGEQYAWAAGYVAVAESKRLIPRNGELQPGQPADRLWATTLLVKAAGLEREASRLKDPGLAFSDAADVPPESAGFVAVALDQGIVTGYEDNTFRPGQSVSRAELAALLDRAGEHVKPAKSPFAALAGTVSGVAGGQVSITKDGVTQPFSVRPGATIVREQKLVEPGMLRSGDEVSVLLQDYSLVHVTVTKPSANAPQPSPSQPPAGQSPTPGGGSASPSAPGGAAGGGTSGADDARQQNGREFGSVIDIEPDFMMIQTQNAAVGYEPHEDVTVVINSRVAKWSDIHEGDQVTAVITDGKIFHANVTTIIPLLEVIDGYVAEAHGNYVAVSSEGEEQSFYVPETVQINRNGVNVTPDQLVPGDRVTLLTENGQVKQLMVSLPLQEEDDFYIIEGVYRNHQIDQDNKIIELTVTTEIDGNPVHRTYPVKGYNLFEDKPPTLVFNQTKLKLTIVDQEVWLLEVVGTSNR